MASRGQRDERAGGTVAAASAVAGAVTVWLALTVMDAIDAAHGARYMSLWRDPFLLAWMLPFGAGLGAVVGPVLEATLLRRVPLAAAAIGVAAGTLAGSALGGLFAGELPYGWLGTTVLGAGAATAVLRRCYAGGIAPKPMRGRSAADA